MPGTAILMLLALAAACLRRPDQTPTPDRRTR